MVSGYLKGAKYTPGEPVTTALLSQWVAVALNGEWRLVDPLWGSRHISSAVEEDWMLVKEEDMEEAEENEEETESDELPYMVSYQCNEFYFLTDPETFIFSHFPVEQKWQLLASETTLDDFTKMTYVTSLFFDMGVQILSHDTCRLETSDGELEIEFGVKSDNRCSFQHCLYFEGKHADLPCDRYVVMDDSDGDRVKFNFKLPVEGNYKFELFGMEDKEEENSNNNNGGEVQSHQREFQLLTAFLIGFKKHISDDKDELQEDEVFEQDQEVKVEVEKDEEDIEDQEKIEDNKEQTEESNEDNTEDNVQDKDETEHSEESDELSESPKPGTVVKDQTTEAESDLDSDTEEKVRPELRDGSTMTDPWDSDEGTNVQVETISTATQHESRRKRKSQKKSNEAKEDSKSPGQKAAAAKESKKCSKDKTDKDSKTDKNSSKKTTAYAKSKKVKSQNQNAENEKQMEHDDEHKDQNETGEVESNKEDGKHSDDDGDGQNATGNTDDTNKEENAKHDPESSDNNANQTHETNPIDRKDESNPNADILPNAMVLQQLPENNRSKRKKSVHFFDETSMDSGRGSEEESNSSFETKPDILVINREDTEDDSMGDKTDTDCKSKDSTNEKAKYN